MNKTSQFLALAGATLALVTSTTFAAPGAHGPDGEHLDVPAAAAAASAAPRIEAKSEAFELVGQIQGGELSILINRFATNEPVLGASVDLESGNLKAKAPYRADQGDYTVADASFLKAVGRPGSHPLVITVTAGTEADLLEGTLAVPAETHDHAADAAGWRRWATAALAGLLVLGAAWGAWRTWRRRGASAPVARRSAA